MSDSSSVDPSVSGLQPATGLFTGNTQVTITGTGLASTNNVQFGTAGQVPISASDTEVVVMTPAVGAPGSVAVTLIVNDANPPQVAAGSFDFVGPTVTDVQPRQGPLAGGTPVTITGTHLSAASMVQFGGVAADCTVVSDTMVTAVSPLGQAGGVVDVQVDVGSAGLTPVSSLDRFAYIPPTVTGLSVDTGPITGGTEVQVLGTGLGGATAVLFGTVGATPSVVTDTSLTVTAPAQAANGPVTVQVSLPTGAVSAPGSFTYFTPAPVNALFVIENRTGVPDAQVHVKFLGAQINAEALLAQTYGDAKPLQTGAATSSCSYTLTAMTAQVESAPGLPDPVPVFRLNDYSGGRIYFSLGVPLQSTTIPAAQDPSDPDFPTVYGYVEPSIFPSTVQGNTNIDASYVDFIGIPFDIAIRNRADGSLANPPVNNPLSTPPGDTVFAALTGDAAIPASAVVAANTVVPPPPAMPVLTVAGTARILSPSLYNQANFSANASPYHDWTSTGGLIPSLRSTGTALTVASYSTTQAHPGLPAQTLLGFSGSKSSIIGAAWTQKQGYALTATAVDDLNPDGVNPRVPGLQGVAGIVMSGKGDVVGRFDVYLTDAELDAPTGIYGANPNYVVDWIDAPAAATATTCKGIQNDLGGRVVGDLLAGFNFGWAGCTTTVSAQATATGTAANLSGTIFDTATGPCANTAIGALGTGEYFYLLSLQPTTAQVAAWFGQSIQPGQPTWYNNYASDFQSLTQCYNMAFTDRLQGGSDPDMFFAPSEDTYVHITLLPGAYAVTLPGTD